MKIGPFTFEFGSETLQNTPGNRRVTEKQTHITEKELADSLAITPKAGKGGKRISQPDYEGSLFGLTNTIGGKRVLQPRIPPEFLDLLSWLYVWDPDLGYAVNTSTSLSNTDFQITFEEAVSDQEAKEMIEHLNGVVGTWYRGGISTMVRDLFVQVALTGAVSGEAVILPDLSAVQKLVKVNPKHIRFIPNEENTDFTPAQQVHSLFTGGVGIPGDIIELNPITYKYIAHTTVDDTPYAVPPLLTALNALDIKLDQIKNLKFIMRKFGMMGFLEVLLTAPKPLPKEKPEAYQIRLLNFLSAAAPEIEKGLSQGLVTGYQGTHEFKYQDVKPAGGGAKEVFDINDRQVTGGLKTPPQLMGRSGTTTETFGRVVLAQFAKALEDVQKTMGEFLKWLFELELILAGFKSGNMIKAIEFDSTLVGDKVREEEATSKKIANQNELYNAGLISQQTRANNLGIDEPDQEEPRQIMESGTQEGTGPDEVDPQTTEANKMNTKLAKHLFTDGDHQTRQKILDHYMGALGKEAEEFQYISEGTCDCEEGQYRIALSELNVETMQLSGGGYQMVDVKLAGGEVLEALTVLNCNTLISAVKFVDEDIEEILPLDGYKHEDDDQDEKDKKKRKKKTTKSYKLNGA